MSIKLEDVQRGYDTWAAKPHNAKWVRKIDGTPIANDIPVTIFDALRDQQDEWANQIIGFLVQHGMLDHRDEYGLDDIMGALRDNYEPPSPTPRVRGS